MEYLLFLCAGTLWLILMIRILRASARQTTPDPYVSFPAPAPESTKELCRAVIAKHRAKRANTPQNQ